MLVYHFLPMMRKVRPIVLILWLAFALRLYQLDAIPPGLTHDEANHGREAIEVLAGIVRFYFPLNYGSEPLYSYTVAGSMALLGENLLALRLVNVFFNLFAIALAYLWVDRVFDRRTALVTAVLMAVSFWSLASSREALRAGMLPFFITGAVWFFWRLIEIKGSFRHKMIFAGIPFGICVAITLHIYLAARVAWLIFPIFLLYLSWRQRQTWRYTWLPTLLGLALAGLLVIPMFVYLENNPSALTRLDMFERPLQDLRSGHWLPIFQNGRDALLAFVWPGYGDQFLAYNIPGRPVFDLITALFFVVGLGICLWRWRQPSYAFVLIWFGVGIIPSLITGPTANTTRNLAALTAVHLLPAIGFITVTDWRLWPRTRLLQPVVNTLAVIWLFFAGSITSYDYFVRWGQSPQVRGAYQHTLVEALATIDTVGPVVISSVYPGPVHDASIGLVMSSDPALEMRWIDARYALLFPQTIEAHVIIPASTPAHAYFTDWLRPLNTVTLRPDDLDPNFTNYQLQRMRLEAYLATVEANPVNFDHAVQLIDAHWLQTAVLPGETAELLTVWHVLDPTRVGPIVPPAYTTDVTLFTHVLDATGAILTQRDALDAPSWNWQPGDLIVQIHPVVVPSETVPGFYETAVGLYDRTSGERRPRLDDTGAIVGTHSLVAPLQVAEKVEK